VARQLATVLVLLFAMFLAISPAEAENARSSACSGNEYSYAGLQADRKAHGVAATLTSVRASYVADGHIGGWIGVGGTDQGPGGVPEWIQVGLASFGPSRRIRMYYEVTVAGQEPRYVELDGDVRQGTKHRFAVLEMAKRKSWWRVWVDGEPVSPPIHLPGSHGAWYPQAVGENWNGGRGTCNDFAYRFENIRLAQRNGGVWRPLKTSYVFQDAGYRVVKSRVASTFLATSL
jgi:hypothetical protein